MPKQRARSRSPKRKTAHAHGRRREQRDASYSYYSYSSSPERSRASGYENILPGNGMMQPWQAQVMNVLERFASSGKILQQLPEEFDFASPQLLLLKQVSVAQNAVIVEKEHRFWLRRISSKVARAGPFGAIRGVLKQHGGRMTVKQCVLLIDNAYEDERLILDMCNMRDTWHERLNLKQFQGEFKRVGVIFDKRMVWMAIKGIKKPGPESETESGEDTGGGPRHVVSVNTNEDMELEVEEALRLTRRALDEVEGSKRGRVSDQEDEEEVSRGVFSDGLPWWGNAPTADIPVDVAKSEIARVTKRRLPAYEMREVVNDAIDQFSVVVVVGATGCGKSTQLPLAWYERCKERDPDSLCRVVCCQPRKIAAMSLAERVSLEIGKRLGTKVGYKIRFETQASKDTDVLYCTTGVLLRAMMRNPTLEGVTCVFIDEVHERDVLADFTMLVLRDLMQSTRKDLKLVLMSATVDPAWCQKYFPDCHAIDLPGDQPFSVEWRWLEDCLEITGHKPQVPVEDGVDPRHKARLERFMEALPAQHSDRSSILRDVILAPSDWIDIDLIVKLVEHIELREDVGFLDTLEDEDGEVSNAKGAVLIFMPGMSEIRAVISRLKGARAARQWLLLPLHSSLPPHEQQRVFERPKDNKRKVIVSTNIAESSVTIDDVVYVIDSGRERLLGLNAETNVSSLMTQWIARSNANQRKGRAGRCRAGSYYTLFSSVQFSEMFVDSHLPEMQRTQVETLCLQAKALGFEDLQEALGRAPDPPHRRTIESAVRTLVTLGAMQEDSSLTRLGRLLLAMPVHPQLGKFLLYSRIFECTDAALTIAAAMDVGRLFTMVPGGQRAEAEKRRMELSGGLRSDHWSIVQAYRSWRELEGDPGEQKKLTERLFISHKSLETVHRLREELLHSLQELQGSRRRPVDHAPSWREHPLDVSDEMALVAAALASSFHLARITPLFDLVCLNSPPCRASMVPLSVNAKRHLLDPRLFHEGLAVWFSRLETSQLFVDDCSIVRAIHVLLLGPPLSVNGEFPRHVQLQPPRHGHEDAGEAHEAAENLQSRRLEREREEQRCVTDIKEMIAAIYEVHNPSKLGEIDGLFQKYDGVEREMYVRICSKYGVEPEAAYLPGAGDDEGRREDEEAHAAMRLQHIERHVPWLKCSSPHALRSLLELREAVVELLGHCVGQPFGALERGPAAALRAVLRILVGAGSLGYLRIEQHHEFGDLRACRQLPAPLEEPWICERRRGRKGGKQDSAGDYAASAPARRERWNRDPEGQLLRWLIGELKELRGHSLEIPHINEMLWKHLGDATRSEALWDLAVTRHFVDKHAHILKLVGDNSVGLSPDYQPSESSNSRSRSRSRGENGTWTSDAQSASTGSETMFHAGYAPLGPKGMKAAFLKGMEAMKGMKGKDWSGEAMKGMKGKDWSGKDWSGKGCFWGPAPAWAPEWHSGADAWGSSHKGAKGSQVRPSSAPGKGTLRPASALGRSPGAEKTHNHGKRRLRVKVANVLTEVRHRQELQQNQERSRHFREQRFAQGRGPAADLGDATQGALGLVRPSTVDMKDDAPPPTSPRRTALLDSLALPELDLLRRTPEFFFSGPAVVAAAAPSHPVPARSQSAGVLGSISSGLTDSGSSSGGMRSLAMAHSAAHDAASLEDLIEFFSCSRADRSSDIKLYARNLRTQLAEIAEKANGLMPLSGAQAKKSFDWRQKMCRSATVGCVADGAASTGGSKSRLDESMSASEQLELMPCMGRHPSVREDEVSPTLARVREVYNRRDAQDARWVEEHREAISCRLALNAFKAKEQQRELLLSVFKQKELHKVRMLEAEVRKSMLDTEARDHLELLRIQKHQRGQRASEQAELNIEEKRNNARSALEAWQIGANEAERYLRNDERRRQVDGFRKLDKYMNKLQAIGEAKHNVVSSQTQKNDELKTRIHASLSSQIESQRLEEAAICAEITDAKLEAAAHRRKQAQLGNRYNFVEKAFGEKAVGFDAKHHTTTVNRHSPSWKRSAEAWAKQRDNFGTPSLPSTAEASPAGRPWTPTGTCGEQELVERMETLAVTLA